MVTDDLTAADVVAQSGTMVRTSAPPPGMCAPGAPPIARSRGPYPQGHSGGLLARSDAGHAVSISDMADFFSGVSATFSKGLCVSVVWRMRPGFLSHELRTPRDATNATATATQNALFESPARERYLFWAKPGARAELAFPRPLLSFVSPSRLSRLEARNENCRVWPF